MLSYSMVWHLLHIVYNILNMQRHATSVAGQTCSYSGKAAKEGSSSPSVIMKCAKRIRDPKKQLE